MTHNGDVTFFSMPTLRSCSVAWILLACTTISWAQSVPSNLSAERLQYQKLFGEAVRSAADRHWRSIVTVERIGADETNGGEVTQDAPMSGVVVDPDGYILTSKLVARGSAASILVRSADGSRYAAEIVAQDLHRNVVLLKVESSDPMAAIPMSGKQPSELRVGETTIALGRYGSDGDTIVSTGILSAIDRLEGIAMQSDARISPSFYGGLLVTLTGDPLGVIIPAVAAGGAEDETSWYDAGVGFAIPVHVIAGKLDRLKNGDDIRKGLIGIVAKSKDPYESDTTVAAVRLRSPAEEAGLQSGDVMTAIAGKDVIRHQQIKEALGPYDAGEEIVIAWKRGDEPMSAKITLAETIPPLEPQRLGIIAGLTSGENGSKPQVKIAALVPGTPANSKLQINDQLLELSGTPIIDIEGLRSAVLTLEPSVPATFKIDRDGNEMSFQVTPAPHAGEAVTDYPASWSDQDESDEDAVEWQIDAIQLPDSANQAAILKPAGNRAPADGQPKPDGDGGPKSLGMFVALCPPGDNAPSKLLESWKAVAQKNGVVVCAIAPENENGWKPKEIEVVGRFVAAAMKQANIHPSAVAAGSINVASGAEPTAADSMALAVAITESNRFAGLAVPTTTRPPAIRMKENEPSASVQVLFAFGSDDELPTWAAKLTAVGYPIVTSDDLNRANLLRWTRLLQSI